MSWNFSNNSFLQLTEDSFKKTQSIFSHTLNALNSQLTNPFFAGLHADLLPSATSFNSLRTDWMSANARKEASALELKNWVILLRSTKIVQWDVAIQNQFPQDSSTYIGLLPHRRKPFQNGSHVLRQANLAALSLSLAAHASLATVKTDVDNFILGYETTLQNLAGFKSQTKTLQLQAHQARQLGCSKLYGILGLLMHHYQDNPHLLNLFFDLQSIKQHHQTVYHRTLKPSITKRILTHTFETGNQLMLANNSEATLRFSMARMAQSPIEATFVELLPHQTLTLPIESFGEIKNRFLIAQNMNESFDAKFTAKMV